ncbi:hypothetical protein ILUMI_05073 [Ignelater luminosus]|uniref:Uncharacterized protein n=1 Tax=Ignelater luminosus TaxID=2038154 RepID=A0A8K0GDX8_IGNLU|nr:hypothetical protein ILUMI_05073 [Ignelater luminosus]
MKQFVKTLDKEGKRFEYIDEQFPELSDAKLKEAIFNEPQIRKIFWNKNVGATMTNTEKVAWLSFKKFVKTKKIKNCEQLGCLMSIKLHFLDYHLDYFLQNLGDYSKEQGERLHQDLKEMERRYQGRWDVNMMADY